MPHKSYKLTILLLTVFCIVVLGGSCLWYATRPIPVVSSLTPSSPMPDTSPPSLDSQPKMVDLQNDPKRPSKPVIAHPSTPALDAQAPQCTRDLDCRGPKQADCIRPACTNGKCKYDYSFCECRTNADCDDGDPCTRNHCFANTMKCVFIKDGCQ